MEKLDYLLETNFTENNEKIIKYNKKHLNKSSSKKDSNFKSQSNKNNLVKINHSDNNDKLSFQNEYKSNNINTFDPDYKKNLFEKFSNFLDKNKFKLSNKFDEKNSKKFLDKKNKYLEEIILSDIIEETNNTNMKYYIVISNYDEEQKILKRQNISRNKKLVKVGGDNDLSY